MTGLNDTDIRLTAAWELTRAADGDAPLCSGLDCLYQNIILEALTQPGDLFYDAAFGWGLYDFIQSEDGDLVRLEIAQRARQLGLVDNPVVDDDQYRAVFDSHANLLDSADYFHEPFSHAERLPYRCSI